MSTGPVIEKDAVIVVSRFDSKYPIDDVPTSYVVGFLATAKANNKSFYVDLQIPYSDVSKETTDDDIIQLAFSRVRDRLQTWLENTVSKPAIIGRVMSFD